MKAQQNSLSLKTLQKDPTNSDKGLQLILCVKVLRCHSQLYEFT